MKTITLSEFRRNIKKYVDIAKIEKVIVTRGEGNAFAVVPLEDLPDKGYDPEFVKSIMHAVKSVEKGNYTQIADSDNIWSDIL